MRGKGGETFNNGPNRQSGVGLGWQADEARLGWNLNSSNPTLTWLIKYNKTLNNNNIWEEHNFFLRIEEHNFKSYL